MTGRDLHVDECDACTISIPKHCFFIAGSFPPVAEFRMFDIVCLCSSPTLIKVQMPSIEWFVLYPLISAALQIRLIVPFKVLWPIEVRLYQTFLFDFFRGVR